MRRGGPWGCPSWPGFPGAGMADARLRRWRLLLGEAASEPLELRLSGADAQMDGALEALYGEERNGGLGASSPRVARWLGDIREFFPSPVVRVMQQDALDRLNLQ